MKGGEKKCVDFVALVVDVVLSAAVVVGLMAVVAALPVVVVVPLVLGSIVAVSASGSGCD
jgi:energy-converting hydrogenase Eha subunit H